MQQAWNRYGGKDFAFTILEFAEVPDLLERERAWIERTRCTDRTLGFNVNPHTTSAGSGFGLTATPSRSSTWQTLQTQSAELWSDGTIGKRHE